MSNLCRRAFWPNCDDRLRAAALRLIYRIDAMEALVVTIAVIADARRDF